MTAKIAPQENPKENVREWANERLDVQQTTSDSLAALAKKIEKKNNLDIRYETLTA